MNESCGHKYVHDPQTEEWVSSCAAHCTMSKVEDTSIPQECIIIGDDVE